MSVRILDGYAAAGHRVRGGKPRVAGLERERELSRAGSLRIRKRNRSMTQDQSKGADRRSGARRGSVEAIPSQSFVLSPKNDYRKEHSLSQAPRRPVGDGTFDDKQRFLLHKREDLVETQTPARPQR